MSFLRLFLVPVCLTISTLLFSQESDKADLEVVYNMKYVSDSTNIKNVMESNMLLLFNNTQSIYFNPAMVNYYQFLREQSANIANKTFDLTKLPSIPKVGHNVYKSPDGIYTTMPLGIYNYIYKQDAIKWTLLPESREILGMKCNLALTKTDHDTFYAWYTTEVPISEGPFKFKGLPGLVLEVYNKNNTISFVALSLEKTNKNIERVKDPMTMTLTKNEFIKARNNYIKYPFQNSNPTKEVEKRKIENLKKWNVFLD